MIANEKKCQLQYIKMGLSSNVDDITVGHVLKTEVFENFKEANYVIKRLTKSKGFVNYGNILLSKCREIKINIEVLN